VVKYKSEFLKRRNQCTAVQRKNTFSNNSIWCSYA